MKKALKIASAVAAFAVMSVGAIGVNASQVQAKPAEVAASAVQPNGFRPPPPINKNNVYTSVPFSLKNSYGAASGNIVFYRNAAIISGAVRNFYPTDNNKKCTTYLSFIPRHGTPKSVSLSTTTLKKFKGVSPYIVKPYRGDINYMETTLYTRCGTSIVDIKMVGYRNFVVG